MATAFLLIGALAFSCLLALATYSMGHRDGYEEGYFEAKTEK